MMIQDDTIHLLQECDAGIKMGVTALDEVLAYVQSDGLKQDLEQSKSDHKALEKEVRQRLDFYQQPEKEPNLWAKSMSWMKTNGKLMLETSDQTAADLITDGCNMGVKTLHRYLNQYPAAEESAKELTHKLIDLEEQLTVELRPFL